MTPAMMGGSVTSTFDLSGRRALVTGSGQGIGLALTQALLGAGAAVALNGRVRPSWAVRPRRCGMRAARWTWPPST